MTDDEILDRVVREDGSIDHLEGALLALAACGDMEEGEERRGLRSGAIANILVDIAQSFRQFNSDRSQWYREVLEVLTAASEPKNCPSTKRGAQPVVGEAHVHKCVLDRGHAGKHTSSNDSEGLRWS